jgi:hypothetical protein
VTCNCLELDNFEQGLEAAPLVGNYLDRTGKGTLDSEYIFPSTTGTPTKSSLFCILETCELLQQYCNRAGTEPN